MGPTASGKTDLAIRLVQDFSCDIISVDSAMVYRGMDIGTAKPSRAELARAPHRLIDICDPAENYSAGQFCQEALTEIQTILSQGRTPLLVGGTMLYFNLLQRGFSEFPGANALIREQINQEAETHGWPLLHAMLVKVDPVAAAHIHPNDGQRIQRALELYRATGKTLSQWQQEQQWHEHPFDILNIIVAPSERALVHARIEERFDRMLKQGLVAEVEQLFQRGDLNAMMPSIRMVGYRQVWSYLSGEYDLAEMRLRAIYATRQFAKRQFTWLRQWHDAEKIDSIDPDSYKKISNIISNFLY
ncbi:MAG: tRNA (adenosine(37)-N6)-dimethylallyltransferase MiaA [Gammaproteobacteria bacterium RIFCSPHIGHO2_12_FULL_41_15]|nr:MAG: tRNA (adenosine(37)-N6)-dimethylallyltransferase MiaA [Gammaproteobacteria bacterium RIFCSPHIGHO2_12_FULL_41_15]